MMRKLSLLALFSLTASCTAEPGGSIQLVNIMGPDTAGGVFYAKTPRSQLLSTDEGPYDEASISDINRSRPP